ncbi:MAG: hypothetical protein WKH68_12155 [Candidatus Limnocylindria bacterium]
MRDPFASYDAWLEKPYTDRAREAEDAECPKCESTLDEDKHERSVECTNPDCDYAAGYDWDAEAERRAEAAADRDDGREVW